MVPIGYFVNNTRTVHINTEYLVYLHVTMEDLLCKNGNLLNTKLKHFCP